MAAGFYDSLARRENGTVMAWGWNGLGQLGDGRTTARTTPRAVPTAYGVEEAASGAYHTLVT